MKRLSNYLVMLRGEYPEEVDAVTSCLPKLLTTLDKYKFLDTRTLAYTLVMAAGELRCRSHFGHHYPIYAPLYRELLNDECLGGGEGVEGNCLRKAAKLLNVPREDVAGVFKAALRFTPSRPVAAAVAAAVIRDAVGAPIQLNEIASIFNVTPHSVRLARRRGGEELMRVVSNNSTA